MKLIVGLGNPGPKYELTRHNAGFLLVDLLLDQEQIAWQGKKFDAFFAKGSFLGQDVCFLKPQTFVNLSGRSVAQALRFFKLEMKDLIVLHDDLDLEFGKVKAKLSGGHGGHNGIRSIIQDCGDDGFARLKVGIGRPQDARRQISDWVLDPFSDDELKVLHTEALQAVNVRLDGMFK